MQALLSKKFLYWTGLVTLGLVIGISVQLVSAWTAPTPPAPGGNVSGPITATTNVADYQTRAAGLGLTGNVNVINVAAQDNLISAPKFCIDEDGLNIDPASCITDFSGVGGGGSSSFFPGIPDAIMCYNSSQDTEYIMHLGRQQSTDQFMYGTGVIGSTGFYIYIDPITKNVTNGFGDCLVGMNISELRTYYFGGGGTGPLVANCERLGTDAAGNIVCKDVAPTPYAFNDTISSNVTNYNLRTEAIIDGWNQTDPLDATVTVSPGVRVTALTTGDFAFDTGVGFPAGSDLKLINNGFIVGKGGVGGNPANPATTGSGCAPGGLTNGLNGGIALRSTYAIDVTNNGTIGGGGGGGGAGGSSNGGSGQQWGGAGGGGAGFGSAGSPATGGATAGGLSTGGVGGSSSGCCSTGTGGTGGSLGSAGASGVSGGCGRSFGGAAGAAVNGNSFITWVNVGTRLGAVN